MSDTESGFWIMSADSDSRIAWHRVQLRKNREALKALETSRFTSGEIAGRGRQMAQAVTDLKAKIAESEQCIREHERRTRRPLATDFRSLTGVNWSTWAARSDER
jgi:hypothetical protein